MYFHVKQLQYPVRVERPDPVYAKQLQELIGGQFGEMTVMNQYLFQGWNLRGDLEDERLRQIKDMLHDRARRGSVTSRCWRHVWVCFWMVRHRRSKKRPPGRTL